MRPRRILAAVAGLIISGALIGAPIAGAAAATTATTAKAKSSWDLKSEVNFNGSSLPDGCVKYTGSYTAGNSAWSSGNATMTGGELKLKVEKKKTGKQPYTTGGMGCWNWPQTYGKFEIKAKVPAGAGINSYITLSPAKDNSANGLTSIEQIGRAHV